MQALQGKHNNSKQRSKRYKANSTASATCFPGPTAATPTARCQPRPRAGLLGAWAGRVGLPKQPHTLVVCAPRIRLKPSLCGVCGTVPPISQKGGATGRMCLPLAGFGRRRLRRKRIGGVVKQAVACHREALAGGEGGAPRRRGHPPALGGADETATPGRIGACPASPKRHSTTGAQYFWGATTVAMAHWLTVGPGRLGWGGSRGASWGPGGGGAVMGQTQRLGPGKVSVCGSGSGSASASSLRGVAGERRVGSLRTTAVRGGTAVYDGGGELSMSGVGRIGALHPGMVSAPACVYASTTSRKGDGGGRQV